ncbi:BRO family protein [Leuconostoc citreum]|uniref:BRO family protein n=2 Tax=Leuconostoc citreum TaxID=33964 RepID=UPI001910A01D|nr:BRO family protein [Leuconostoc citreum]QQE97562.1 ORF6C domain-containing protein [Leuconostoc citreum]
MNKVEVFNFETNDVRTVVINSEAWFVGKDVADALGYTKSRNALTKHVDEDDALKRGVTDNLGRLQETTLINESGVYSLIFGSKLENAKRFKKWVTSEVLPAIRKTGSYSTQMTDLEKIALLAQGTTQLNQRLDGVETKVDTYIENQALNATDYGSVNRAVNHRVYAYASIHHIPKSKVGPLFKDLGNQIKQVANVGNRSRIKSKDYDIVIQFIDNWEPSTATKTIIEQMELDVKETA